MEAHAFVQAAFCTPLGNQVGFYTAGRLSTELFE